MSAHQSLLIFVATLETAGKDSGKVSRFVATNTMTLVLEEIADAEIGAFELAEGLAGHAFMRQQFSRGSRLFVALDGKTIAAVGWVNTRAAHLGSIGRPKVTLPKGYVYCHSAMTGLPYRRQGIGQALRRHLLKVLQAERHHLAVVAVLAENAVAAAWQEATGLQRWGRIIHFQCAGRAFWWTRLTAIGHRYPHLLDSLTQSGGVWSSQRIS